MSISQTHFQKPAKISLQSVFAIARDHTFPRLWVWVASATLIAVDAICIGVNPRLIFDFSELLRLLPSLALLPILVWRLSLLDEKTNPIFVRTIRCVMMIFYILPTLCAIKVFNHVMMTIPMPLTDSLLTSWDHSLGLDWLAYSQIVGHSIFLNGALNNVYYLLMPGIFLIGLEAIIIGESKRCNELLTLILLTAIFTLLVAGFFPAIGAMDYLGDATLKTLFSINTGNSFVTQLQELRGTAPVLIGTSNLEGLAAFPSFHTVASILMMYSSRGNVIRQSISCIFAAAVLASTPTFGGHYFVDMIAGAIVAIGFILCVRAGHRARRPR
jgi:membrane-associated phospholipid phosphatase